MAKVKHARRNTRQGWVSAAVQMPGLSQRDRGKGSHVPHHASIDEKQFPLSEVFREFFPFVAERHAIFRKRLAGEPRPWTEDPILDEWPFTNVFRVLDRNTQYILRNVIRRGCQTLDETFFRVLLFRIFNKIETWEILQKNLGVLTWKSFSIAEYEKVLSRVHGPLYSAAYIMPAPQLGYKSNYQNHLRMIETMMAVDRLHLELTKLRHLKDAHGRIQMYQSMGDFMAMQLVLDLNMMPQYNWDEDEWVALGPGSQACLLKMFGVGIRGHELSAVEYIRDNQHSWFIHCGVSSDQVPRLHASKPAGLTMVDIEHALCECEKYSRGKFPDIKGKRTNVGRRLFVPRDEPVTAEIPDNWLSGALAKDEFRCPPPVDGTDDTYEVSHIIQQRGSKFLIRWLGYGPEDDSWIPADHLGEGAGRIIAEWESTKARIQGGLLERAAQAGDGRVSKRRRGRKTI